MARHILGSDRAQSLLLPASVKDYPRLRASQRRAFALPGKKCGPLEGPPGTGKTTTLGMLLATLLLERPACRVLLLSTTNTAVDIALVAVDRVLEEIGKHGIRRRCKRIGHHFQASHHRGREHPLPSADPELVARLAELESSRPEPHDAVTYSRWKQEVEVLRAWLRVCVAGGACRRAPGGDDGVRGHVFRRSTGGSWSLRSGRL